MPGFKKTKVLETWDTPFMRGEIAEFLTPSRQEKPVRWIVVHRPAAIAVAPVTEDGRFLMIHQERIGSQQTAWEFPAGQIDEPHYRRLPTDSDEAESIRRQTVRRELREEAGYELAENGDLTPLGRFFPSPGFTDEVVHLYLANPVVVHPHGTDHDEGEAILDIQSFSFNDLESAIANGSQEDALTLALYARLIAKGLRP